MTVTGGEQLINDTKASLEDIWNAYNALPESSFADNIVNDINSVEALYQDFTTHTRFFKSDMSSLLGISITFNSGDGD